jgi:hypothetical protein
MEQQLFGSERTRSKVGKPRALCDESCMQRVSLFALRTPFTVARKRHTTECLPPAPVQMITANAPVDFGKVVPVLN